MSYITLFCSGRKYYRGNKRILWKHARSVDIIHIQWKYPHSLNWGTIQQWFYVQGGHAFGTHFLNVPIYFPLFDYLFTSSNRFVV